MEIEYLDPQEIEKRSFEIIEEECKKRGIVLPKDRAFLIKRVIHTTADFEYAGTLHFSKDAVKIAQDLLLQGADIVTDTNMALSGISRKVLSQFGGSLHCYMAEDEVAKEAAERNVTRASVSMEKGMKLQKPVIFAIGNAPTALLKLREFYDAGKMPAFVIGVPVGFVNVEAAKEKIMETKIPCIVNRGRKGGSNVAAAICNALLYDLKKRIPTDGQE